MMPICFETIGKTVATETLLYCRHTMMAVIVFLNLGIGPAAAQPAPLAPTNELSSQETTKAIGFSNGSFIVAPIPFNNPSLGAGLALGSAYLFKVDPASGSSSIGLGAFKTDNDSQGYALGWNVNLASGRWTSKFLLADADLNYQLYVNGRAIPVSQSLRGVSLELGRTVSPSVKVGFSIGYGESSLSFRGADSLPPILVRDNKLELLRSTVKIERDLRDDNFFPKTGSLISGALTYGQTTSGPERNYVKGLASARRYWPVGDNGVLAVQGVACANSKDAPFFDSCALGAVDAFRGYVSTEFIDDALVSAQIEYRGKLIGRLGFVVFAGVGSVGGDIAEVFQSDLLAAIGLGARIRLSKSFPVDYAVDVSLNERGDSFLYVSVGQRF